MSVTKGAFRVVRFFCGHENTWTLHPVGARKGDVLVLFLPTLTHRVGCPSLKIANGRR